MTQFSNIQFNDLVSHDQVTHGLSYPFNFEDNIFKKKWGRYMDWLYIIQEQQNEMKLIRGAELSVEKKTYGNVKRKA